MNKNTVMICLQIYTRYVCYVIRSISVEKYTVLALQVKKKKSLDPLNKKMSSIEYCMYKKMNQFACILHIQI